MVNFNMLGSRGWDKQNWLDGAYVDNEWGEPTDY